jgi:hypothetical protein
LHGSLADISLFVGFNMEIGNGSKKNTIISFTATNWYNDQGSTACKVVVLVYPDRGFFVLGRVTN